MTSPKASPETWELALKYAKTGKSPSSLPATICVIELLARVEALEANTKQWRIDYLKLANTCASLAPDRLKFFADLLPDSEDDFEYSEPGGSLVERVQRVIGHSYPDDARAAIVLIANEIEHRGEKGLDLDPCETADWLRRAADPTSQED